MPGIDVTDDPLLQARLFSYLDTQLTRLGGPNFDQIPINRPHAPVNDMLRDGMHQTGGARGRRAVPAQLARRRLPVRRRCRRRRLRRRPAARSTGAKVREPPASFDDHFSQARLFWLSMTPVEQEHIVAGVHLRAGQVLRADHPRAAAAGTGQHRRRLCADVATGLGLPAPEPTWTLDDVDPSPALSQLGDTWPVEGRTVGIVVDDASDPQAVNGLIEACEAVGLVPFIVGPHGGTVGTFKVDRTYGTARSFEFDALVLGGTLPPAADAIPALACRAAFRASDAAASGGVDARIIQLVGEMWRHCKVLGSLGSSGQQALESIGVDPESPGVVNGEAPGDVTEGLMALLALHRVWDRF